MRHPDIEAAKRRRRAQLGFALILIAAYSALIFVIRERQAAAALLETQMAATVADHWLAKDSLTIAEYADDHLLQKLPSPLFDYSFAIYSHALRRAKAPDNFVAPDSLPQAVWNDLVERETRWSGSLPGLDRHFAAVILPAKDAEQWDVVGAVLVAKRVEMRDFWQTLTSTSGVVGLFCAVLLILASLSGKWLSQRKSLHWWSFILPIGAWALVTVWDSRATQASYLERAVSLIHLLDSPLQASSRSATQFAFAEIQNWGVAALLLIFAIIVVTALAVQFIVNHADHRQRLSQAFTGYAFLAPSFFHLVLFSLGPILFALFISFHSWSILQPERPFVGMANYVELIRDADFWGAFRNTALYTLHVPFGMAVSLALALLMNQKLRGVSFFRTVFFLPSVTSFVAIAIVWQWIYHPDFGLLNYGLHLAGLGPYPWLNDPRTALLSLMIMAIWIQAGYQMVIYLAGLQSIPQFLYDAAIVDGANKWQRFWRITLPMLQPTSFFILVTSIIGSFQVFTQVYVMTEGGPMKSTEVMVYHIYKNAWDYLRMGYASAMSFVLFALVMLLTLVQFRFMGKRQEWW